MQCSLDMQTFGEVVIALKMAGLTIQASISYHSITMVKGAVVKAMRNTREFI